jgi:hypothetical protein
VSERLAAIKLAIDEGRRAGSEPSPVIVPTPFLWIDAADVPPREWLYAKHFIRRYVTATVAPGGLGKSSLELVEALAMATGRDLLGVQVREPLRVWYWNGEDPIEEIDRRVAAICLHYGITEAQLGGRFFRDSGRTSKIVLAQATRDGATLATPVFDALQEALIATAIDVAIFDPFVATHAISENDNGQINMLVSGLATVAERTNASIELVHHVRKSGAGGRDETTIDDARGAGALVGGVRSARVLNVMGGSEADAFGVSRAERWAHFRVDNGKANMAPRSAEATWRKLENVSLGNGSPGHAPDQVGVVCSWASPASGNVVTEVDLAAVLHKVRTGEWRQDPRAGAWVGHAVAEVLGLNLSEAHDKAQVSRMINAWLKSGTLRTEVRPDASRQQRPFVVVGEATPDE